MRLLGWILLLIGIGCLTQSQAFWQSRDSNYDISISGGIGGETTGPGDLGIAGISMWWGLRCYQATSSGNVADVWDSATGNTTETLLKCSGSGGKINQTINPLSITCAIGCVVATLYDQSGQTLCNAGASPCNLTQATNANRPTLIQNCLGIQPCMAWTSTQLLVAAISGNAVAQTFTVSSVAKRTGSFTSQSTITGMSGGQVQVMFFSTANQVAAYAGTLSAGVAATDSSWHALQMIFNNASSTINVDNATITGSLTTNTNGWGGGGTLPCMGKCNNALTGNTAEVGVWSGGFSAGNQTAMCHNQYTYWGTSVSC